MKKVLFLIILTTVILFSCKNETTKGWGGLTKEQLEKSKLLKNAEKYCISQLDNPKSYSLINISIVDTLTVHEEKIIIYKMKIRQCEIKSENLETPEANVIEKDKKELNSYKELLNTILKEKDNKEIKEIHILIAFRASNKFGAIVKNNNDITYTPKDGFEMELN